MIDGGSERSDAADLLIGVLALQGDFAEHLTILESCGYRGVAVRSNDALERAGALIIPGGESTTMLKLIERFDMRETIQKRILGGMPVFGTCAGAIVLAERVSDGEPPLGVLPLDIERNAYGRQVDSFESEIDVPELGFAVRGVFIRAPVIKRLGAEMQPLAWWRDSPVLARGASSLVSTFHPEIAGEFRLHRYFVEDVCAASLQTAT